MRAKHGARREFWLEHLRQWREQGGTLKAYADANNLPVGNLYAAKSEYETKPAKASVKPSKALSFLPVQLKSHAAADMIRVSLPNGVTLQVPRGLSLDEWQPLLMLMSQLR